MVEREKAVTLRDGELSGVDSPTTIGARSPNSVNPSGNVDGTLFLEALDEVMSDHHNVLAALAK